MKIGFTIGKFSPLHKGHQYLIETALSEMDKLVVVVYDTDNTSISTEKRAMWVKKLYPNVETRIAHNPPSQYGLDDKSVKIQMDYLNNIIKDIDATHFYSSEPYGEKVANYLNIVDRRVDPLREKYPISGSDIRLNLAEAQKWIEKDIYNDILGHKNFTNN